MATRTKHMERSHRSYRNNIANKQGFYSKCLGNAESNRFFKNSNKGFFGNLLSKFRKNKGDK